MKMKTMLLLLKLLETMPADELALEVNYIVCVAAKKAGGLIFFQNDPVFVGEYLDRIIVGQTHYVSELDRYDESAEGIDLSYDSCRFHFILLSPNTKINEKTRNLLK